MELLFLDSTILLNGCYINRYILDDGERIDFLCLSKVRDPFFSAIYCKSGKIVSKDFEVVEGDSVIMLVRQIDNGVKILCQEYYSVNFRQILCTVFYDKRLYVSMESDNNYNVYDIDEKAQNLSLEYDSYTAIIYLKYTILGKEAICAFSPFNFEKLFKLVANKIEINGNSIHTTIEKNDILGRNISYDYLVENNRLTQTNFAFNCTNAHVNTPALVGILFLEGVVAGDFDNILEYLDESLKGDIVGIKEHFVGATDFVPICKRNDLFVIEKNSKREIYQFIYQDGKICDILSS